MSCSLSFSLSPFFLSSFVSLSTSLSLSQKINNVCHGHACVTEMQTFFRMPKKILHFSYFNAMVVMLNVPLQFSMHTTLKSTQIPQDGESSISEQQ